MVWREEFSDFEEVRVRSSFRRRFFSELSWRREEATEDWRVEVRARD